MGFLGIKLSENDDKKIIYCYPTSFLTTKDFWYFWSQKYKELNYFQKKP